MTEHEFLAAMLGLVAFEVLVGIIVSGYFAYRIHRSSQQIEGLTAATFLEARRALSQPR
ncbi:MAG: hypothetical protein HYU41_15985 [Candidatus Rokubacteria bacterium]|nr:hypothetical protein [Candidatus Rokubacteria bacterium]